MDQLGALCISNLCATKPFLYKTTDYYAKDCEGSIVWDDQELNIAWPLDDISEVLVTEKDRLALSFQQAQATNVVF